MGPYYDVVCASLGWPVDDALRQRLRCVVSLLACAHLLQLTASCMRRVRTRVLTHLPPSTHTCGRVENDAELAKLDAVIADAKVQHGDVEVATAATKKAAYLAAIGDKVRLALCSVERRVPRSPAKLLYLMAPPHLRCRRAP